MLLKSLTLRHLRAFNHAEFTFQPGMNLIVGVNGVGKSTVLDTLRLLLSQTLPKLSQARNKPLKFEDSDIAIGQDILTAELNFEIAGVTFNYIVNHSRAQPNESHAGVSADFVYELPPKSFKNAKQQPLALYFSPRRAFPNSNKNTDRTKGLAAAFTDALNHRELRLMEFADWWLAQIDLAAEGAPNAQRHLDVLAEAVTRFLDNCTNVQVQRETYTHRNKNGRETEKSTIRLTIDKAGTILDLCQLSDGERGILAIVLDLARRLSQANPNLEDPLQVQAVVLIDELDLHLHPQWQRTIVSKLTATFPNCQFIATTHSPLIIGEVEPENIILIAEDGEIIHPNQSLGMDTDWILKYIMGATTRHTETTLELKRIADLIENEDYDSATDAIDALRDQIGEFPELVRLQTRIDRLQLLGE